MNRLLLVDGDPRSLNVLGVSLTQAGYEVTGAVDGVDALAKIDSVDPQLLVTAARLRRLDGFELVRQLRGRPNSAAVAILVITGEESVDERRRVIELGVDDYVTKPVFVRELVAKVHLLFARRARESLLELQRSGGHRLTGSTRDVAVVDLVQSMDASGESGVLHMSSGTNKARMYFRDGHVVDADLGTMRGEEAIYRAFLWYDAIFELDLRPVTNADVIVCSTQTIVRKGMQRIDAWLRSGDADGAPLKGPESSDLVPASVDVEATSVEVPTVPAPPMEFPTIVPEPEPMIPATQAPAPAPVAQAIAAPKQPTAPRSSDAPWTREIERELEADEQPEDDAAAAGLPRRAGSKKGIVFVTVAAAAAVLLAAGMRSSPRWQPWRAIYGGVGKTTAAATPPAVKPASSQPEQATGVAIGAVGLPSLSASPTPSSLEQETPSAGHTADDTTPASAVPAAGPGPGPGVARVSVPAFSREIPIDIVKLTAANLSPLVRDAQKALLNGDTQRALALAKQAVTERPADADAWLTLAAAQKASGDFEAARETYLNCVQRAQTATLNHCRILGSRQRSPEAHAPAPSEATTVTRPEVVAEAPPTTAAPPPRTGIRAPQIAPPAPKSNDSPPPRPTSGSNEAATSETDESSP
jgi:CheY-like chemotaxis protein